MPSRDLIERVRKALGDRYNVVTAVGRGGNAFIFGAYDQDGQRVAIKVLHPELAVSVAADRFLREIRYASQLNHPHIARLLDSGETDYLLWFAMPYLPGETLRQVLRREARLAVDRAARAGCEILDALGHAHQHGIAHRDIKPDNIVLSPTGAVLVDLGIARAIARSGDDRVTGSGFVVGTEEYMSPEQAEGAPDGDGRTDLYSLGGVLFDCVAVPPARSEDRLGERRGRAGAERRVPGRTPPFLSPPGARRSRPLPGAPVPARPRARGAVGRPHGRRPRAAHRVGDAWRRGRAGL